MQLTNDTPVIDFHSHFLVQEVFDQCHCHSPASGFGHHQAPAHLVALFEKMKNPRLVIEDMDRLKIDMSVSTSATVIEPTSWAEPAVELELVRRLNDTIAEWAAQFPRRIIGSFVLPFQDMGLTLQELTRAVGLGLRVANIPSEVRGSYLGDRKFWPFWESGAGSRCGVLHAPGRREVRMVSAIRHVELDRSIVRRGEVHGLHHL
jgi:aminocarboxymuconate-semialdehyde decarboxylase